MTNKLEDSSHIFPQRRGRLFKVNDEWYFATREATGHGPFSDYESAENACREYVLAKRRRRMRRVG